MDYHPNIDPAIVDRMKKSEEDGGIWLKDTPDGACIKVQTRNTLYTIDRANETIKGHSKYCPFPTKCVITGSTWGTSMLKMGWIGIGMCLEFWTSEYGRIVTSTIQSVDVG